MEKLKYNFKGTDKEIVEILKEYKANVVPEILERVEYARGNNPEILRRKIPKGSPGNRIPISYARRIVNIVTGYMYTAGLINYASEDETYLESISEIFKINKEPQKTEQVGRQVSIQGVGYEIFYAEGSGLQEVNGVTGPSSVVPMFENMPVASIIPIYNHDISPKLTNFIYYWFVPEDKIENIWVYDDIDVKKYIKEENATSLISQGTMPHGFDTVPLVVYENNVEMIGDFSPVVPLIDSYDALYSDSMNEFERFAWAYLILKGMIMDEGQVAEIKDKRVLSLLNSDDSIDFLTKDINSDYIRFMSEWARGEIHRQSGIPNIDDYKFGGDASGETIGKFIYLMELFTDPKESYFKQGLGRRIDIISSFQGLGKTSEDIDIIMNRNVPDVSEVQAKLFNDYAAEVSLKTRLENFADFVDDPNEEMEQLKEEQAEKTQINLDNFEARTAMMPTEDEEEEEDEEE